jgi:hypothetical protein
MLLKRSRVAAVLIVAAAVAVGCGDDAPVADEAQATAEPAPILASETEPGDPTLIKRPFTAEEIRAEWVPGLRLLMRRSDPEETRTERWTVVSADDVGAEIEYAAIADDGSIVGEPTVGRSTWIELRDHASFPAAASSREWVTRSTQLGEFEGWLYRVAKDGAATVQEFFFVPEMPGAPVHMRILEGDTTIFELEQTARLRPQSD